MNKKRAFQSSSNSTLTRTCESQIIDVNKYVELVENSPRPEDNLCQPIPDVDLDKSLTNNKEEAMVWNSFVNSLVNLPDSIGTKGNPINNRITNLIGYSRQIINGEDVKLDSIIAEVTAIINAVNDIIGSINSISNNLSTYMPQFGLWNNTITLLQGKINDCNDDIHRFETDFRYASTHPTKKNEDIKMINQLNTWQDKVFNPCKDSARIASSSLQLIIAFWAESMAQFEDWLAKYKFEKLLEQPDKIVKVNLDHCQTEWNNTVFNNFKIIKKHTNTLTVKQLLKTIPTNDELVDYINSLLVINKYAYAISSQNLPTLVNPPQRYSDYVIQFLKAKNNPNKWTQTYLGMMINVPNSIVNHANPFSALNNHLQRLIDNPSDTTAKDQLKNDFNTLEAVFNIENENIQSITSFLVDFNSSIGSDTNTLKNLSDNALKLVQQDKNVIINLNAAIESLENRIAKDQHFITVDEIIGKSVNLFLDVIGINCSAITEVMSDAIGKIINITNFGTSDSIFSQLATSDIEQAQKEIKIISQGVKDANSDVILLTNVSSQFDHLTDKCSENYNALSKIMNMWYGMSKVVKSVFDELEDKEWNDLKKKDYEKAMTDLNLIKSHWDKLVATAKPLTDISFSWQEKDGTRKQYGVINPKLTNIKINTIPVI